MENEHEDHLSRLLSQAAYAVEDDPKKVLLERRPEYDKGLNCNEINRIAREVGLLSPDAFIIESGQDGESGDSNWKRWVVVYHPDPKNEPVHIDQYSGTLAERVSLGQAKRVAEWLRAWKRHLASQCYHESPDWIRVTDAGYLLLKDLPKLKGHLGKAKARVSKAASAGKFKTNGKKGYYLRIDAGSFAKWRLKQRDADLEKEDEPEIASPKRRYGKMAAGAPARRNIK
jgi:hypothetical protein